MKRQKVVKTIGSRVKDSRRVSTEVVWTVDGCQSFLTLSKRSWLTKLVNRLGKLFDCKLKKLALQRCSTFYHVVPEASHHIDRVPVEIEDVMDMAWEDKSLSELSGDTYVQISSNPLEVVSSLDELLLEYLSRRPIHWSIPFKWQLPLGLRPRPRPLCLWQSTTDKASKKTIPRVIKSLDILRPNEVTDRTLSLEAQAHACR